MFDLVLLDDKNPRSVLFQITAARSNILNTCRASVKAPPGSGKSIVTKCLARLNQTDVRELAGRRPDLARQRG